MPDIERKITWNLMLGEESTTKNITNTYNEAGFDPDKHLLMNNIIIEGTSPAYWRTTAGGGPIIDWNLMSTLDGLYVAGEQHFSAGDHSFAASTGRYAGRKAAAHARQLGEPKVSRDQISLEKARVYAPVKRTEGIDWKELHAGVSRAMQMFCSEYKTESLLNLGLQTLQDIQENHVPRVYALDPHKLMRSLEDVNLLTHGQIIMNASLARRASSKLLDFRRIDYPEIDPPEWGKFVTVKLENNRVTEGSRPLHYWGDMKKNYEAHNTDYQGVYQGK
jgi:succinate dehydrogenase/fumarate reductase flavoprotein subunit